MGASDFTENGAPYTYDDLPAGQTDPTLSDFSVAHDLSYILPALRMMLSVNPDIYTLANPWTAPPWMKSNDAYSNIGAGLNAAERLSEGRRLRTVCAVLRQVHRGLPLARRSDRRDYADERAGDTLHVARHGAAAAGRDPVSDGVP